MRRRDLILVAAAVLCALTAGFFVFRGSVLETGNWGLSFRQEGTPPVGNAGKEQLKRFDAAYIGDTADKVLYLTFDAGYENGCTEKILDTLQKHQVPALLYL